MFAKEYGATRTMGYGFGNEIYGFMRYDILNRLILRLNDNWAFQIEDLVSNQLGIDAAECPNIKKTNNYGSFDKRYPYLNGCHNSCAQACSGR